MKLQKATRKPLRPLCFWTHGAYMSDQVVKLCRKHGYHGTVKQQFPGWYCIQVSVPIQKRDGFLDAFKDLYRVKKGEQSEDTDTV